MKELLLILLTTTYIFAKPCMTDIYTGNGINTNDKQAANNMIALRKFMLKKANPSSRLDAQGYGVDYSFQYIHNPDYTFADDMIELYYQLYQSGQVTEGYFYTMFAILAGGLPDSAMQDKLLETISNYEGDLQEIYDGYQNLSFKEEHNVLLVSHSQGNLMGNKLYTMLSITEKKKFRMVSVATPASYVLEQGKVSPCVTVYADPAILAIRALGSNSLPGNVNGSGHNFIGTYMNRDFDAPDMIASFVKIAYDNLRQTSSCNKYEYYVWIAYQCPTRNAQELEIDIYGSIDNGLYYTERELVMTDTKTRMPRDSNGNCTVGGNDVWAYWGQYDKNGCLAYNIEDTAGTSRSVDTIKDNIYTNGQLCTHYEMKPEVVSTLKSMESF